MVCLARRDPVEMVGPPRLSGVVVRPLNFTVRRHQRAYVGFELSGCCRPL